MKNNGWIMKRNANKHEIMFGATTYTNTIAGE